MKYNSKEKVYGELSEISKEIVNKIKEKVNSTDDFFWGWIEVMPKDKIWVRPAGQKLITTECGSYLWQRVQIEVFNDKQDSKELLKKLLEQSGLKRFHDEDGCNGYFRDISEDNGYQDKSYCYVNPFFKEGYWENHTLETRFIAF